MKQAATKRARCQNFLQDGSGGGKECGTFLRAMYITINSGGKDKVGLYCPGCKNMEPLT